MNLYVLIVAIVICYSRAFQRNIEPQQRWKRYRGTTLTAKGFTRKGFGVIDTDPISARPKIREALSKPCPCCSGKMYENCCFVLHNGDSKEILEPQRTVQARFTAYALGLGEYLISTLHPTSEDYKEKLEIATEVGNKKLMKAWVEETNQAFKEFNFIYFKIVAVDDVKDKERLFQKYPIVEDKDYSIVRFHYLSQNKKTLIVSPVDEISLLLKDSIPTFTQVTDPFFSPSKQVEKYESKWYYSKSLFEPIEEQERNLLYERFGFNPKRQPEGPLQS